MFNIYYADCLGREGNCLYPHKAEVTDAASLAQAVGHDYVCAEYKNSYRSKANFLRSNCLAVEFDNDHSENPDDWVTPEDLRVAFPDVTIGIHYSRNHLKEKNGKPARPKFHAFLEIEETEDPNAYSAMKRQVAALFPFVDTNALDAARFFYGTADPQTEFFPGIMTLNAFFEEEDFDVGMEPGCYGSHVIKEGSRNSTMSRFAGRVVKRYGWNDASHKIFLDEAAKCDPPLDDDELMKIWRSARKFEQVVSAAADYVPPEQFNIANLAGPAGCLKPEDYSDIGQAKILSHEYGDEICFNPATDFFRYNGTYWIESREEALGAAIEFLDQQLADAELLMFTTKQAVLNSGADEEALSGSKKAVNGLTDEQMKLLAEYLSAVTYHKFGYFAFHFRFFATYLKMQHKAPTLMYYMAIKAKGAQGMKISVEISPAYTEPYAVIYTSQMTDDIQRVIEAFGNSESPITALLNEEDLIILQPKDIYMIRVENGDTIIYGKQQKYRSRKRLYELGQQLGKQFMQISKSTLVNLSYMDSVESGFSGTLLLKLRNGCKDYVSRTYLPEFKKYLGL